MYKNCAGCGQDIFFDHGKKKWEHTAHDEVCRQIQRAQKNDGVKVKLDKALEAYMENEDIDVIEKLSDEIIDLKELVIALSEHPDTSDEQNYCQLCGHSRHFMEHNGRGKCPNTTCPSHAANAIRIEMNDGA